ncbi:hypothetical protein COPRO5265_0920 [Coprothermobacter proteolyticus DSM 5265]|uniref:Uncharacterized protein n=1 Tax=Coprothermobacter proteolyticus (strain ATCC 35245 / DSM 5265 / OCM 4 / BT) TaxID=309798 RepID=B5Y902_COPPD|nr:hypothetical protein [Coprothermobacter proteolyticus]ACI16918.1 hypothetical protein COPRO5265_0920 [Coprothermobacter proteolyticus DSM 5265]
MEYPEIRLKYFDEAVSEGTITSDLNADVIVIHQKISASVVNAFFRHGGKCLMSLDKNGAMLFFRHKWLYVPF